MVRQLRVEAGRALRRAAASPPILGAGFDPGVVNAYCRARRQGVLRHDRHDRHPRRQRRQPRPLLRHQLRPGDQLPRVRQGVDVDRPRSGSGVPDPHGQARRSTSRSSASSRSTSTATTSCTRCRRTSTPTASASGWASATTTSTCSPCCARSACCRTSRCSWRVAARSSRCRSSRPCCPTRRRLAAGYTGKTCIGNIVKGTKDGKPPRGVHLPGVRPRRRPTPRSESQGISYTAGVPPIAAAVLIADGAWDARTDGERRGARPGAVHRAARRDRACRPEFLEIEPDSAASFHGEVRSLEEELADSTATVTVSAADPMIAVRKK